MYDWAEFRILRYLLAVVELKGFRAAAEYLHTAQPNLSAQAKQFQEASGLRLYRTVKGNRIRLTETGVAFKPIVRGLLNAQVEAMDALRAIERGEIRALKLGCATLADEAVFHDFCKMHKELLPDRPIHAEHGDTVQLIEEILSGEIDGAIVIMPVSDLRLRIEEIRRDRLVVCLRADDRLAGKTFLDPLDLQDNLKILYHPQRHPGAHRRLLELLHEAGVQLDQYSRVSHPSELQSLVKQGYGFALIREGIPLDPELTTRPIAGVDWTVDMAFVYKEEGHPKTIPVLLRQLKSRMANPIVQGKKPPRSTNNMPEQLSLLG
jgi:DNA-binding transcriptional LysR family regulator